MSPPYKADVPLPPSSFHSSLVPASLPTSVAIPIPSLQSPAFFSLYAHKPVHSAAAVFARGAHELTYMSGGGGGGRSPVRDDSPNTSYAASDSPSMMFKDSASFGDQEGTVTSDGYALISFHNSFL